MFASFLGTKAGTAADLTLVVMLIAAVMLTIGWRLAAGKKLEAHRWVQTIAVCLNTIPIVTWMFWSFGKYVVADLPGNLSQGSYLLTTIHAVAGAIGAVLGVSVVIRANQREASGRSVEGLITSMRIAYVLYMLVTAAGVVVYYVLYR